MCECALMVNRAACIQDRNIEKPKRGPKQLGLTSSPPTNHLRGPDLKISRTLFDAYLVFFLLFLEGIRIFLQINLLKDKRGGKLQINLLTLHIIY